MKQVTPPANASAPFIFGYRYFSSARSLASTSASSFRDSHHPSRPIPLREAINFSLPQSQEQPLLVEQVQGSQVHISLPCVTVALDCVDRYLALFEICVHFHYPCNLGESCLDLFGAAFAGRARIQCTNSFDIGALGSATCVWSAIVCSF